MSAVTWMKDRVHTSFPGRAGFCLGTVRRSFGAGGGTHDAQDAWDQAKSKHKFTGSYAKVPANRPFFYSGGSRGYGHVVVTAGNGWAYGTDMCHSGRICLHRLSDPVTKWGFRPLGYTDDINHKVIVKPTPKPVEKNVVTLYRKKSSTAAYLPLGGNKRWHVPGAVAGQWRKKADLTIKTLKDNDPFWKRIVI